MALEGCAAIGGLKKILEIVLRDIAKSNIIFYLAERASIDDAWGCYIVNG